ncbi:GTP 3',8-cyclase MoaA [Pseudodesulfovibrio sp.]|uniref:GTP 3',8-cyclase MoaA n=1 Tax=unclassified Pseudodesulfovibrio TaxID=2661612 RepID=UPI003AFFA2B0
MRSILEDSHGRKASYMRVSVTDRCNLRCVYCAGAGDFIPHPNILRYEEILELMDMAQRMSIEKIRFTGGEPFVRKGFGDFLVKAAGRFPDLELCVTTNATLLGDQVERLAAAGVRRINISLDTMDPEKFARITGRDLFSRVRESIDRCLATDVCLKVNAVAMKGVNDDEVSAFVELARTHPMDVRFIEFMPVGLENGWKDSAVWKADDILKQVGQFADITPVDTTCIRTRGPARMYAIEGGLGRIGVISAYSNHFCDTCNRLRLTSDGKLRTCLFSDKVYRLRPALRHPKLGIEAVERIIRKAGRHKPIGHELLERTPKDHGVCRTRMASIGG